MATRSGSASGRHEAQQSKAPVTRDRLAGSVATAAGGLVIVTGAALSLVFAGPGAHRISPAAAAAAIVFGLVVTALGAALRLVPGRHVASTAATTFSLSVLGGAVFALTGVRLFGPSQLAHTAYTMAGFIVQPWLARPEVVTLSRQTPMIGTVVAVGGCLLALPGAISARQQRGS